MPAGADDWQACYRPDLASSVLKLLKMAVDCTYLLNPPTGTNSMAEGMVAMVKGLRECGLAVALMGDDGKTYTLVPNPAVATETGTRPPQCCDSGAQVTDGRYATVYKMQHCNMAPTSPPALYTEFPPQRTEMCPGHGNFQVGGTGSGETGFMPAKSSNYRGAMCWADRGSVCSPRPSRDPDAFANSLRKYPVSSPERSQELMERLVNYSQGRNYPRSPQRNYSPPNRSYDTTTPLSCQDRSARGSRQGLYEPDRRQRAPEDCPTRDRRWPETESYMKPTFSKNSDARFMRDVSKRLKESIKSMSNYNNSSVDMETQVAYDMISRTVAVATVPVPAPISRSVAVPLSAVSSAYRLSGQTVIVQDLTSKSVQTVLPVSSRKSIQTSTSSIVLSVSGRKLSKERKSFSNYRIDEGLKEEILQWLEDNSDPKLKKLQDVVMKKLRKRFKKSSAPNSEKFRVKNENKDGHYNNGKKIIDSIISELNRMHLRCCKAVESAGMIKATCSDQSFEQTNKVWINNISIKKHDFPRTLKKELVYDAFVHKIKSFKQTKPYRTQSLRTEILNLLHDVPIDFYGLNKVVYLNTLADAFVTKLNKAPVEYKNTMNRCGEDREPSRCICDVDKYPCQSTIKQLKILVADSVIEFTNKIKTKLKPECVEEVSKDLVDILLDAIRSLNLCDENFATDIGTLIKNTSMTMLPENEATNFAIPYTGKIKNIFNGNEVGISSQPETVFVLQSTNNRSRDIINNNDTDESNSDRTDAEDSSELNIYKHKLLEQIDAWVCSLNIPLAQNEAFRKGVVSNLADDIVDRYKYLELNKDCVYKTDDLEHLKYQIFKWINKLVGDGNNEAVNHATELFETIREIKKPGTTSTHKQNVKFNTDTTDARSSQETPGKNEVSKDDDGNMNCVYLKNKTNSLGNLKDPDQKIQMLADKDTQTYINANDERYHEKFAGAYLSDAKFHSIYGTLRDFQNIPICTNQYTQTVFTNLIEQGFQTNEEQGPSASMDRVPYSKPECCKPLTSSLKPQSLGPNSPTTPSIKQLNDEFDEYLNNWVNDIPIQTNNPEEVAVAQKARIGIRHGIWKAIARVKFEPAVFHNRFYYEDVLEDAIDDLLDILPQTQELKDKRYMLKAKLIEKTMDITELIKIVATPASYKQQLAQQVAGNLQRRTVKTEEEDPKQLYEEMIIQCIAEDFILASSYKDEDKLKESAYRNKVKKKVEELIDEAKKNNGKDAQDLNNLCIEDIITALRKVPVPSEATIREEADEIILGHEIDKWFADLPIIKNDNPQEKLHRRRLKDALTIKLHQLEKNINFADCYDEPEFKHEISLFLDKVPLEKDESLNINFMVGELANRIKNRQRPGHKRKSVAFQIGDPECCRIRHSQDNGGGEAVGGGEDNNRGQENGRVQYSGRGQDNDRGHNNVRDQVNGHGPHSGGYLYNGRGQDGGPNQENGRDQYSGRGQDSNRGQNNVHTDMLQEGRFTRQPFDEDDYHEFYKEKPANSTMINPPSDPRQYNNEPIPDFRKWGLDSQTSEKWHSFDNAGNIKESREPPQEKFDYVPGQFQEQPLGGKFGDVAQSPGLVLQQSSPRNARYDARDSANATRQGPPIRMYFDKSGNYIPSPVDQNQPNAAPQNINRVPLFNNQSAMQEPKDLNASVGSVYGDQHAVPLKYPEMNMPPVPADDRPMDMSSFRQFTSGKPASSSWQDQPEDEYHSLLHDSPPRPTQFQHRSHFEPYELPPEEVKGGRFALDGTRSPQGPGQETINPSTYNPGPADSVVTPNHHEGGFVKSRTGMNQDQSNPEDFNLLISLQPPSSPGSHRINSRDLKMTNRVREAEFHRSLDRVGIKQTNEQNRSPTIGRDPNAVPEDEPPNRTYNVKITEPIENSQPSSSQRPDEQDQRFLAETPPQTGLSIENQPVGSSTPNQRLNNDYPPNIKERRQVERGRQSRRDNGTDDDQQGRQRCLCLERLKRCTRQPNDVCFQNWDDRRPVDRDRQSERDYGNDDDVEGARRRCQCVDGTRRRTRRCDTWYDYEDCIPAGIPLIYPYPYFTHPCFNLRKKSSRHFPSRPTGFNKRFPKFPH